MRLGSACQTVQRKPTSRQPTVKRRALSDSHRAPSPPRETPMIRTACMLATTALASVFLKLPPQQGGDLGRRIVAAPDGLVKMTYAARDGICGDGRSFIAEPISASRGHEMWFTDGMSATGFSGDVAARCASGPVRLLLVVRDHRVVAVQPFVGPSTPATERAGTELGTVAVADVSRYLLELAAQGREGVAHNAMLAATIADSVRVAQPLASIARNKSLATSAREQ